MKNKSLLMAAVAFFTALNVQAYFDPSIGRWASRDPAGEDTGELNLYGFVSNDPIGNLDEFGLSKFSDFQNRVKMLDQTVNKISCCCPNVPSYVGVEISGTSSGTGSSASVTGTTKIDKHGCINSYSFEWLDCYTAHDEAGFFNQALLGADFHDYGYNPGGDSYTKSAHPGMWAWTGAGDPYHIAMDAYVIYIYCGGGYLHASYRTSNELIWTWNKKSKSWTGPSTSR